MFKSNYLFSKNQIFDRKHADQKRFEIAFSEEIPLFVSSIDNAFERMKSHRSEIQPYCRDRNLSAVLMSGFLRGELYDCFGLKILRDATGRYYFSKDKEWILYFKKLNSKTYLPENIETKHVAGLNQQLSIDFEDRSSVIYIGFTVTKEYDYITGYHAVYSRNGEVIWRSSLDGLSSQVFSTGTPSVTIPDITITGQDKEIQIRRKSS